MNTTITCTRCKQPFEWQDHVTDLLGPEMAETMRPRICDNCDIDVAREAEETRMRALAEFCDGWRLRAIQRVTESMPALFRATDMNHAGFNQRAWRAIHGWQATPEKPWLGLVGGTGGCKSRIAYLVAMDLITGTIDRALPSFSVAEEWSPNFRFVPSYVYTEKVMLQFGESRRDAAEARQWLDSVRRVKVLLLDDLGKGKLSPAVATELYALVNHRHEHQLLTIWTANSDPEKIAEGMSEDMAAPFAGRINESSRIFRFK